MGISGKPDYANHEGTLYLSHLVFPLGTAQPFLLSSTVKRDNLLFTVDLTNPDVYAEGRIALRCGDLHIFRAKFIWRATCYEWLRFINYGLAPLEFTFSFQFDADLADLFEVRGVKREKKGARLETEIEADRVAFSYRGPTTLCAARKSNSLQRRHADIAHDLCAQAQILKQRFNRDFWCDELSTYAIALDRDKRRCEIRASNAGHCLFTGIATDEYARRIAETLLSAGSFSGWGIRTLDIAEVRYNPMSYQAKGRR